MDTAVKEITKHPYVFNEFFSRGKDESISPFLTPGSRHLAKNLFLKVSIVSAILLVCAFIGSFVPTFTAFSSILLLLVYFFTGVPALIEAINDVRNGEVNIDVLMVVAAFLSVLIDSAYEGALLLVLFAISGAMEEAVLRRATSSILNLKELSPTIAHVIKENGSVVKTSLKDIRPGQLIHVKMGAMIPLDGTVIDGIASLHMAHLTGETLPEKKQKGDFVVAGAYLTEGFLTVKVTKTSQNSTLAKIIEMIRDAQRQKPVLQRWFDRFSRAYAITIMLVAFGFALFLPFVTKLPFLGVEGSIYRGLTFLIAASPCALIIAVPIAYLSAISACARRGILLKGGNVLDALQSIQTVAFDKTGTITTGKLSLVAIEPLLVEGTALPDNELLSIAYTLERNITHPFADAIVTHAENLGIAIKPMENFRHITGQGVEGEILVNEQLHNVAIGNIDYVTNKLALNQEVKAIFAKQHDSSQLHAMIAIGRDVYCLVFSDQIKPEAKEAIALLKARFALNVLMLSGDRQSVVDTISKEVGLDKAYGALLPENKLSLIADLAVKDKLLMVGDGINDAPALARATVGIAMGGMGSTTAIDASDAILLQDNLSDIPRAIGTAKKTKLIVKQNVMLASCIIAFISIPALLGYIPLWLAVILHEGGTVLVGLNSLRLLRG